MTIFFFFNFRPGMTRRGHSRLLPVLDCHLLRPIPPPPSFYSIHLFLFVISCLICTAPARYGRGVQAATSSPPDAPAWAVKTANTNNVNFPNANHTDFSSSRYISSPTDVSRVQPALPVKGSSSARHPNPPPNGGLRCYHVIGTFTW